MKSTKIKPGSKMKTQATDKGKKSATKKACSQAVGDKTEDAIIEMEAEQMTADNDVAWCENLRTVHRNGCTMLEHEPGMKAVALGKMQPLVTYHAPDGEEYTLFQCVAPMTALYIHHGDDDFYLVADGVESCCAIAMSNGFLVMTASGPVNLNFADGEWTRDGEVVVKSRQPEVVVDAYPTGGLTIYTNPCTLTGTDFSRTAPRLSDAAEKLITNELIKRYELLAATAADGAAWMQPAILRYNLLDTLGRKVYTSAPFVLSNGGWQCVEQISVECEKVGDSTLAVPLTSIEAETYRPRVRISSEEVARLMAQGITTLELCMTPQMHIVDKSATAAWRIVRQRTDTPGLTLAMPGATDHFASRREVWAGRMKSLLQRLDEIEERVAMIDLRSFDKSIEIRRGDGRSVSEENQLIAKAISSTQSQVSAKSYATSLLSEISSPNRFTARTAVVSGQTVVWGDITPIAAESINVAELTGDFKAAAWSGVIVASDAMGSERVMAVSGSLMPRCWGGVVSYPDPKVNRLQLFVKEESTGEILRGEIALTTSGDGLRAIAVAPDLKGKTFTAWSGEMPSPTEAAVSERRAGALVAASLTQPLQPTAVTECCHSAIKTLFPALRSRSSWDFARCHLYAISEAATYAVSVNGEGKSVAATMIDNRGVASHDAAAYTPGGVMMVSGDNLLKISASRVDTVMTDCRATGLAWDDERQRLWLVDEKGMLRELNPARGAWSDVPSVADIEKIASAGGRVWLTDRDELYRLETERELEATADYRPMGWKATAAPGLSGWWARVIEVDIAGEFANLEVSVLVGNGPGEALEREVMKLTLRGRVSAPIVRQFVSAARPYLAVKIKGTVKAGVRFRGVRMWMRRITR